MKIYLSSTFQDLRPHRTAVAAVLRRMGHQVIGMEEYVAEGTRPLARCLEDVRRCDAFVGVIGWRYGYVPDAAAAEGAALPGDTRVGETSVTEFEYRQAVDAHKAPLMFLLDPQADWPANLFDAISGDGLQGQRITRLRTDISRDHLVGLFRTPDELASLVSAAIYRREIDRQMSLESLTIDVSLNDPFTRHGPLSDSSLMEIQHKIAHADEMGALRIDVGAGVEWWSTRLYFLASLAADLAAVPAMIFVDGRESFIGMVPPRIVQDRLAHCFPVLREYESENQGPRAPDLHGEVARRTQIWETVMNRHQGEQAVKVPVTRQELRRWLGTYLMERALEWGGAQALAWQLQRVIDWPTRFVPVTEKGTFVRVVDRQALTEQLARLFIADQVARLQSMTR